MKIENKLNKLGYQKYGEYISKTYAKEYAPMIYQTIEVKSDGTITGRILAPMVFTKQEDIQQLQIAFNRLQEDLKELKNGRL